MLHGREAVGYGRTGESAETLARQAALRLLRGESPTVVESSLLSRGVYPVEPIMERAIELALENRR